MGTLAGVGAVALLAVAATAVRQRWPASSEPPPPPRTVLPRLSVEGHWSPCADAVELAGRCRVTRPAAARAATGVATRGPAAVRRTLREAAAAGDVMRLQEAVEELATTVHASAGDAASDRLIDLAAGRILLGLAGDGAQLARAADELLRHEAAAPGDDPRLCFNRALAFELLGLLAAAEEAWRRCDDVLEGGWRQEARERRRALTRLLPSPRDGETAAVKEEALAEAIGLLLCPSATVANEASGSSRGARQATLEVVLAAPPEDATWSEIRSEAAALVSAGRDAGSGCLLADGLAAFRRGEYEAAAESLDEAAADLTSSPGLRALATLHGTAANLLVRPEVSRQILSDLVGEAEAAGRGWVATYGSRLLVLLAARTQSPLDALAAGEAALATATRFGYRSQAVDVGMMVAETYESLGRHERAWQAAATALREASLLSGDTLFFALNLSAGIAEEQGLDHLAAWLQSRALDAADGQAARTRANGLLWRALMRHRLGEDAAAADDVEDARRLIAEVEDGRGRAELASELRLIEAALEVETDPAAAIDRLGLALHDLADSSLDNTLRALRLRARALARVGRLEEAADDLWRAIEVYRSEVGAAPGSRRVTLDDQVAFQGQLAALGRELVGLELRLGRAWRAFALNEGWKDLAAGVGGAEVGEAGAATLRERVARRLSPAQAIVSLGRGGDQVVAWVVRPSRESSSWRILGDHDELLRLLEARPRRRGSPAHDTWTRDLYRWLIEPLPLAGVAEITVLPDPGLETIPLAALVAPTGELLVERFLLRHAYAASDLLRPASPVRTADADPLAGPGLVVRSSGQPLARRFGLSPLAAAAAELRGIAAVARRRDDASLAVLRGAEATPGRVLDALAEARWAHLIGHTAPGPFPTVPPALLLTMDDAGRGWVTADDVARRDLGAMRFVVLSTCSSAARGRDGWMSRALLARGFLAAGVGAVVSSLGPVEDRESAELFRHMYRELGGGVPVAEALRRAQVARLRSPGGLNGTASAFVYLGVE